MKLSFFILLASVAFAGQSIEVNTGYLQNSSVPAQALGSATWELSIHDWPTISTTYRPATASPVGFEAQMGASTITIYDDYVATGGTCIFSYSDFNVGGHLFLTFRYQRVPITGSTGNDICEAWDINGGYHTSTGGGFNGNSYAPYTGLSGTTSAGVCVQNTTNGCTDSTLSPIPIAYYRLYTTTFGSNATPPTTAQSLTNCLVAYKFDGGITDSCTAGPYNLSAVDSATFSFVSTPGQTLVVAIPKSSNIPSWDQGWANWISARLGFSNGLDGTGSYSQTDASPMVTCAWTYTGTPAGGGDTSMPIANAASCGAASGSTVTYTPNAMGTHTFTLIATDVASNVSTPSTLGVGAVAYDANCIIQPLTQAQAIIFGPMIAFGCNPWGYEDQQELLMVGGQLTYFQSLGNQVINPTWATAGAGTASYVFDAIGSNVTRNGTALTGNITSSSTSIGIANAAAIPGLLSLPDLINVAANYPNTFSSSSENIRVCTCTDTVTTGSCTSGTTTATLGVCYDGRGISTWVNGTGGSKYAAASSWSTGAVVAEGRVSGTSSKFVTDSNVPICPGGAPGPPGPVTYSTGHVMLAASSTAVTGVGTTWNNGNGVYVNYFIRVNATHGGGTPFTWWSIIDTLGSTTAITADRPTPSDVDTSTNFTYEIISYHNLVLQFMAPDPVVTLAPQLGVVYTTYCESDTAMFFAPSAENDAIATVRQTPMVWTYDDALGINTSSGDGPNFYGSGQALRSMWFRSGLDLALSTANLMDETWPKNPETGGGWSGGPALIIGGGFIGAIADLTTNPSTTLTLANVRHFATVAYDNLLNGGASNQGCSVNDARTTGYWGAWIAMLALFETDPTQKAVWQSYMGPGAVSVLAREQACQDSDNSWSNSYLSAPNFSGALAGLTVTNGSPTVTGTGIPSTACYGIATGTVTMTHGSTSFTGTGLVNGSAIWIEGTVGGVPTPIRSEFTQSGGTTGILAIQWPDDSGTYAYLIENNVNQTNIASSLADPATKENYGCTWVNSTTITLDRNWDQVGSSTAQLIQSNVTGYGQQPFLLGIKTQEFRWASYLGGSVGAQFATMAKQAAGWIFTTGFDSTMTKGLYYARGMQACEPATALWNTSTPTSFDARQPGCNLPDYTAAIQEARTLTAETGAAIGQYFTGQGYASAAQTVGDIAYGALWGVCSFTSGGGSTYYCDANGGGSNLGLANLSTYKWSGFHFGMGQAHQWPAMRILIGGGSLDFGSSKFSGSGIGHQ